jgi:DMSO/TMAO reductase YedYZ molybdopterin-dependent catalytic subunit
VEYLGGDEKTKKTSILVFLFVISLTIVVIPKAATAATPWDIQVTDLVGNTTTITYDQLLALPQTTEEAALYCYGSIVTGGFWTGVRISDLLSQIGADSSVSSIGFGASDGYRVVIPIEVARQTDVIIAYQKDYTPLGEGYRLVIPYANGAVWISQITSISLSTEVVPVPQSQTPALTDSLYKSRFSETQASTQSTPAPTSTNIQQIPIPNPTQTPHNQITPNPTAPFIDATEAHSQTTFPLTLFYVVVAGFIAAVVVVTITFYKRKKV